MFRLALISSRLTILEGPTDMFLKLLRICHKPSNTPTPSEMTAKLTYLFGLLGLRNQCRNYCYRLEKYFCLSLGNLCEHWQIGHLDALDHLHRKLLSELPNLEILQLRCSFSCVHRGRFTPQAAKYGNSAL
jgi:hypothetical protein